MTDTNNVPAGYTIVAPEQRGRPAMVNTVHVTTTNNNLLRIAISHDLIAQCGFDEHVTILKFDNDPGALVVSKPFNNYPRKKLMAQGQSSRTKYIYLSIYNLPFPKAQIVFIKLSSVIVPHEVRPNGLWINLSSVKDKNENVPKGYTVVR